MPYEYDADADAADAVRIWCWCWCCWCRTNTMLMLLMLYEYNADADAADAVWIRCRCWCWLLWNEVLMVMTIGRLNDSTCELIVLSLVGRNPHPHISIFFFFGFCRASSTAFPWGYSSTNFGGASWGLFIHLGWPHFEGAGPRIGTQARATLQ